MWVFDTFAEIFVDDVSPPLQAVYLQIYKYIFLPRKQTIKFFFPILVR